MRSRRQTSSIVTGFWQARQKTGLRLNDPCRHPTEYWTCSTRALTRDNLRCLCLVSLFESAPHLPLFHHQDHHHRPIKVHLEVRVHTKMGPVSTSRLDSDNHSMRVIGKGESARSAQDGVLSRSVGPSWVLSGLVSLSLDRALT